MDFKSLLSQLDQLNEATTKTKTGIKHTSEPGGYGRKDDEDDEGKKVKAPTEKKGRGRPAKATQSSGEDKKYDFSAFGIKAGKDVKLPKYDKKKTTVIKGKSQNHPANKKDDGTGDEPTTKKKGLKEYFDSLESSLNEAEQVTIAPAQQNTQVIKQGDKTLGTVTNPQLAAQIKQSIGKGEMSLAGDHKMTEGSGYDGSEPLDLSKNPSINDVFKRALYIYDYEGYGNDMDYSEDDAIDQYVAKKFGQDVLDKLTNARNQQYFGRDDGKGPGGGGRTSNLGRSSAPGGNFRTTKAGVMNKQDAKTIKGQVANRLGRHPKPNLPEGDIGKHNNATTGFDALVRKLTPKYGVEAAKRIAGAQLKKIREADQPPRDALASPLTLESRSKADNKAERAGKKVTKDLEYDMYHKGKDDNKAERAGKKVTKDIEYDEKHKTNEGKKPDANKNGIPDYAEDGKGKHDLKKKKMKEDMDSESKTDKLPSMAHIKKMCKDGKTVAEICKMHPDCDQKELKQMIADCKKKMVKEGMEHKLKAAYHAGKAHGLTGGAHHGKNYEDMEEARQYHEGYKCGLDECYGQMPIQGYVGEENNELADMASYGAHTPTMEDDMYEMDKTAYMKQQAIKTPGDTFKAFGQTFKDKEVLESPFAFEALDKQLSALLEGSEVTEGMTVSISKGQQGSPDSVSVSAQDGEAEQLLSVIKQAGLGLFGGDEAMRQSSPEPMTVDNDGEPSEVGAGGQGIEVVGDHDGMMSLMKKLSGIGGGEHSHGEETCESCGGMMEAGHSCSKDKEMVDEVESEDQMTYQMAEDNPPDSGAAEVDAEDASVSAANAAAAAYNPSNDIDEGSEASPVANDGIELGDAEEEMQASMNEEDEDEKQKDGLDESSFFNLYKKLSMLSEESTAEKDDKAERAAKKIAKDIEYDEGHKGKDDDKAETAGKKVKKDIEYDDKKDKKEKKVDESFANSVDDTFETDIDFMMNVISGGLNKRKSTGQTTIPVVASQLNRTVSKGTTDINESSDTVSAWRKLAGIK
jgi:hypothetical protein